MFAMYGNDDWNRQLLHYARVAKEDTASPVLVERLEALEQLLLTHDECDRRLVMTFEIPTYIEKGDLATELDCERVTHRFPDSSTVELTVVARGSKSYLEQLARHAFDRSVRICKAKLGKKLACQFLSR